MSKTVMRFKFFDMPVNGDRTVQISMVIMLILTTVLAIYFTNLTPLDALIAGILATIIWWFSDITHQYGHFFAAKQTGKPARGLRLWWLLGSTLYPRNETGVTHAIHVRRALGGPIASLIVLIICLGFGSFLWDFTPFSRFIVGWAIFVNAFLLIGALAPAKIGALKTDGMVLLEAYQARRK